MKVKWPTKKKIKIRRLEDEVIFIYGPPKIGKSSLANLILKTKGFFYEFEKGLEHLNVFKEPMNTWSKFVTWVNDMVKRKPDYVGVVIDTVPNMLSLGEDAACKKLGVEHPSDAQWGKGWKAVKKTVRRPLTKLSLVGYGLIMIAHSEEREVKTQFSHTNKKQPEMDKTGRTILLPMADIIMYIGTVRVKEGGKRVYKRCAYFRSTPEIEAGQRTKILPKKIIYDTDEELYMKMKKSYDNHNQKESKNV